jgi:hypothetical protein
MLKIIKNLKGIARVEYSKSGSVRHCTLDKENEITTSCGTMIPRWGEMNVRRKNTSSVSFYKSGEVKRIALEEQTRIKTPLGDYPAELVTFYESGAVKRFFPLDGQISGYWSEKDEEKLLESLSFALPFGGIEAKIIGCCFYESGALKSITLWPSQTVKLPTSFGLVSVRNGFSLYENGELKSVEPTRPTAVPTPIGLLKAYDSNAVGINADNSSLMFDAQGGIYALTVPGTRFTVSRSDGKTTVIEPLTAMNPLDDETVIEIPVKDSFSGKAVCFDAGGHISVFDISQSAFAIETIKQPKTGCAGLDCSQCQLCLSC